MHQSLDRPQLSGTSRHLTGAYSIKDPSWDAAATTLKGQSDIVPGEDYTLFFHLPPGRPTASTAAASTGGKPIPVRLERKGDLLSVSFKSPESPVAWQIKF
ncbi:hypothetical protein BSZ32_10565 [Rubritalea profundi]|uniref:Uncharacterized protein n=1 Tax=Rubritalea profundi TaxID=1658618 RepID=A0A2S7U378_9BACT|nr:hypothetical protein BSZ32_10565 [Rubritalea profundi]